MKVADNGNVGIQVGTITPLSSFCVNTAGDTNTKAYIQGDTNGLQVKRTGVPNYPFQFGILGHSDLSSNNSVGIRGQAYSSTVTYVGRSWGVWGLAGNATSGYNYGVFGTHYGTNDGAGIVGSVNNNQDIYIPGIYAGYFEGDVAVTGIITAQNITSSDKRLKQNIKSMKNLKSLDKVQLLNPVEYNLKQRYSVSVGDSAKKSRPILDEKSQQFTKKHFGLIAQELQEVYPDLVYESPDGMLAVDYVGLIPVLIQSIQELKSQIDMLTISESAAVPVKQASKSSGGSTVNDFNTSLEEVKNVSLEQNAPNPFSNNTEIKYSLPQTVNTAYLCIYDLQGRQLKQITLSKRGNNSEIITGSEFTPGIYLYTLIVDGQPTDVKKMILTE